MNTLNNEAIEFSLEFDYDDNHRIMNPGKFEGERQATPYFYYMTLESAQDDTIYSDDGELLYDIFQVTEDDKQLLPELENIRTVKIFTDSQGFCYSEVE